MIYLHKILPLLVSPLFFIIVFISYGALKKRSPFIYVGILMLWVLSTPLVATGLQRYLEKDLVRLSPSEAPDSEAIVVLSGMLKTVEGIHGAATEWNDPDRFFGGIELYHARKSQKLVFTQGILPWQEESRPEGEVLSEYAVKFGVPENSIYLTKRVNNTEEEAEAVKQLLGQTDKSIILVTSAFHMPRALTVFRAQDLNVFPYPVDFKANYGNSFTVIDLIPKASAFKRSSLVFREILGRTYYTFKTMN